jgi:phosphatidylserine decarboxylase
MRLPFAKYGLAELFLATVVCGLAGVLAAWLAWPAAVVPLALWLWVLWFFRDPQRQPPAEAGVFLSPADGRVTDITAVGTDGELGLEGLRIGIFMSVFDVHVNRSPCAGVVERIDRHRGTFLDARDPAAWGRNESATIRLGCARNGEVHPVIVRQVAGLVARRIVTDAKIAQEVVPGQRIGMIKFGSRVELAVARSMVGEVRVQVGQTVRAGQTVLMTEPRKGGYA